MYLSGAFAISVLILTASSLESIPSDQPISAIVKQANERLAAGDTSSALTYFDAAVARDPSDYLTLFKRGAAYLSLGKSNRAEADFGRVLEIKPGFEGALIQRARLRGRAAKWKDARIDYEAAGRKAGESEDLIELEQAAKAAKDAEEAEAKKDWETCVATSSQAIAVASVHADLRRRRARCRFERGELLEAVADLQHVLHISTEDTAPYLQASATLFYAIGSIEKGLTQIRKCLQSDPDSKTCRKLMKKEKAVSKVAERLDKFMRDHKYSSAVQMLIDIGDTPGLLSMVKEDMKQMKADGYIHGNAPEGLYTLLVENACEAYFEMNNMKRARTFCDEARQLNPTHTFALLVQAQQHMDNDEFEAAIQALNDAKESHPNKRKVEEMMQKAQMLLKRSKSKDYYKVLGVDRDADERTIKKAYRQLTKKFHPDKAVSQGVKKEDAEKKMAEINEAYEVLGDSELRARFDQGDDPNDQEPQARHPFHGSPFGGFPGGGQQFVFRSGPGGGSPFGGAGGFQFQAGGFPFG